MTFVPPIGGADHFTIKGDFMKKWNRIKPSIVTLAIFAAIMSIFALFFTAIMKPSDFFNLYKAIFGGMFLFFGGGTIAGLILLLLTKIPESACHTLGYFFFYSMIGCYFVMVKLFEIDDPSLVCILSAVISGLCCYIYWLKELKCEYEEHD
jgi:peptidoglycan/LPS O-acetylase OafA/YrhL